MIHYASLIIVNFCEKASDSGSLRDTCRLTSGNLLVDRPYKSFSVFRVIE